VSIANSSRVSSCFSMGNLCLEFGNLDFSNLVAQALPPTLPQQLINRCVDRSWFADYGGTDFSNFTQDKRTSEAA
jgi:hypothetical protein